MNVLIVDDESDFVEGLMLLLQHKGHAAKSAGTIRDARRLLQSSVKFDVMLLDFMLPDGCGIELLDDRFSKRVVMITGHPGVNAFIKSVKGPNVVKLSKPASFEQILDAIEQPTIDTVDEDTFSGRTIRQVEKMMIQHALKEHRGCKRATAKALGISLNTLYNRLDSYGISLGTEAA